MAEAECARAQFGWPLVVKPDIGCNGTGVRLVRDRALSRRRSPIFRGDSADASGFRPRSGRGSIFYIRHPHEAHGRITSLTLKSSPAVIGDGNSMPRALLMAHPRASKSPGLSFPHLRERLTEIPAAGAVVPLVFTGNHCRGSVFKNGAHLITAALTRRMDDFARNIPDFHFGRIDVRFRSEDELRAGNGFTVIEINGVGSEATQFGILHSLSPEPMLRNSRITGLRGKSAAPCARGEGGPPVCARSIALGSGNGGSWRPIRRTTDADAAHSRRHRVQRKFIVQCGPEVTQT